MADNSGRQISQLLTSNERVVLDQWVAAASEPLRGRVSEAELQRSCGDLLTTLISAVSEAGLNVRADAYAGARALLADMSRDRARRGFTPSETLKETLFALASERDDSLAVIVEASRWVDALG